MLGLVFGTAAVILAVSSSNRPPAIKLPDPNGYDDLARAGSLIHGDWPNKGDLPKAKIDEVRAFIEANKASLDLARVGLGRECVVPIENSQEGLNKHIESSGHVRKVSRLLTGEALIREADGKAVEAARTYLDILALGQAMTQGGMGVDVSVGWVIQGQQLARLRGLRDQLPTDTIRIILRDLESLDRRRATLDAMEARRSLWYQGSYNLLQRTMLNWSGIEKRGQAEERQMANSALARIERPLRFLMVELAIHAYHEDKKSWPRSEQDLVPDYLNTVPIDPTTGKPIEYPPNTSGELTDDLTSIAHPDGLIKPVP